MRSRGFERLGPFKAPFAWLERRWARQADAVLTVNDAYADLLAQQLGVPRPPVVRNTPNRYVRLNRRRTCCANVSVSRPTRGSSSTRAG